LSKTVTLEQLEAQVIALQLENDKLKSQLNKGFTDKPTVSAPEPFKELFDSAQSTVKEYFKNILFKPDEGTIEINDERYVLVRASALSYDFFNELTQLYKDAGEENAFTIGQNFLFDIGHVIGREDAKSFHKKMNLTDPVAKLSAGPVHFAYSGWAFVDILPESSPSPDDNYFLKYNHPYSFEADSWIRAGKQSDKPVCIMNAAYSSGWCSESYGIPLTAVEVTCKAKGDEKCTFIMAPPHQIEKHLERENSLKSTKRKKIKIPQFFERKKIEEEVSKSLKDKEVLLKEVHHRVKNNLQIISSLLNLQQAQADDEQLTKLYKSSQSRINAMALVHEKLYSSGNFTAVDFEDYLESILLLVKHAYVVNAPVDVSIDVTDEIVLTIDQSIPLGLVVNEILINAFKHAFFGIESPSINIICEIIEGVLNLEIKDNGIGISEDISFPSDNSLGFELIDSLVNQLDGTVDLLNNEGTSFKLRIPLD
jgi:two-component sensor histidine kinase/predicted hydrocarbon binding protein